ncbi:MAG: hypothetical protein ACFCBW_22140 [Candidatus Competibacterales bacterium]
MDSTIIFHKTPKGLAEIERRSDLPLERRHLLIMVDGKRSVADYIGKFQAFGDVPVILEALAAGGYIAPLELPPPTSASAKDRAQPPTQDESPRPLPFGEAKDRVKALVREALGGGATSLVIAIDETLSFEALLGQLERARTTVATKVDAASAEAFWRRARPLLPADLGDQQDGSFFVNL